MTCGHNLDTTGLGVLVPEQAAAFDNVEAIAVSLRPDLPWENVRGTTVEIVEADEMGRFTDRWNRRVYGHAECRKKLITIGRTDICRSVYIHELLHIMDNCVTGEHQGWDEDGRRQLVNEVIAKCPPTTN